MSHTYKQIEIVGSSKTSIEDAVSSAIAKASETIRNIQSVSYTHLTLPTTPYV